MSAKCRAIRRPTTRTVTVRISPASLRAAASKSVTTLYRGGIAPDVKLVNVRVLGSDGTGWTSDVIAGIEWVIENRAKHNIGAINLSLGHPEIIFSEKV